MTYNNYKTVCRQLAAEYQPIKSSEIITSKPYSYISNFEKLGNFYMSFSLNI